MIAQNFHEVAAHFGVSRRRVKGWRRQGAPPLNSPPPFDLAAIQFWKETQERCCSDKSTELSSNGNSPIPADSQPMAKELDSKKLTFDSVQCEGSIEGQEDNDLDLGPDLSHLLE